ncbi:MAG: hypothetical protein Q9M43_00550 [Sulfurimonas sp.]|nr:hypothetical protein [Sulfurimonas sp.]
MSKQMKAALTTDIVLIDIIGFSKLASYKQLEIIKFVTASYKRMIQSMLRNSNTTIDKIILGLVPTGDGFFCILNPRLQGYGAILGLSFKHLSLEILGKFSYFEGMRIAVHNGEIYKFKDILGHSNFIGDGLNDCARYLEFKDYSLSTVMVSNTAYDTLKNFLTIYKDYNTLLSEQGFKHSEQYIFYDKHGGEKKGTLIWLRKPGIINPPNINFNSML